MASEPRYVLVRPQLLRDLMARTGSGASISGRELAVHVGVPSSTINALLTGTTQSQPETIARGICEAIGIDLLCLWAPRGRSARSEQSAPRQMATV